MDVNRLSFKRTKDQQKSAHNFIDQILQNPPVEQDFFDRVLWLKSIIDWMRKESPFQSLFWTGERNIRATRLKYVLNLLERNPEWKRGFSRVLISTLEEISARDAFCQLGLPSQLSFFGELFQRIGNIFLPREPVDSSLLSILHWIFPSEEDADWIESIDSTTVERLFAALEDFSLPAFERDRQDALLILASFVRSIGLSYELRRLISSDPKMGLRDSPFYQLQEYVESRLNPNEVYIDTEDLHFCIDKVRAQVTEVYKRLEVAGVSISLVYQIERVKRYLDRIESLLQFSHEESRKPQDIFLFLALLVRDNINARSLKGFVRQNISLLSKRIVKTNSEIGEHYISRDRVQLNKLFRTATGGGVITVATVYGKIFLSNLTLAPFIQGILNSINYAISFVAIQLAHFTLASKQPANTAPALAQKIGDLKTPESQKSLVDEIVLLVRSQIVSILGNAVGVVPTVILIGYVFRYAVGVPLFSNERANYILESHGLFGPTLIFAAFTGVLLFLSSLFAGLVENWFTYRKLRRSIARNERLIHLFGKVRTRKISEFLSRKIAALTGNISLGFLLGLTPEVMGFLGIPLEVRHVTLSFGTVAAAIPMLEFPEIISLKILLVCIALLGVGVMNVGVSFCLALFVAIRAKEVKAAQTWNIILEVLKRLRQDPLSFVWAPGEPAQNSVER